METVTKPGYKHTELGWIPEDWEVKSLNEIGFFKKGKGIKKDQVSIDGVGCVRYGELYTQYNSVIRDTKSKIPKTLIPETQKIETGDLLFAGSGETKEEIGKCAAYLGVNESYAGGDIIILTPKTDDSIFLGYLLNQRLIAKQKAQYGQGDAVVHIYSNGLGKVKIPLPPLHEQIAIATALSDMDSYISSLETLIAKKRLIKQGAMRELLTPKEDWKVKKLGEVFNISGGYSASRDQLSNEGYCYLHYGDIHGSEKSYVNVEAEFGDIPKLEIGLAKISSKSILKNGDIVFVDASEDMDGVSKYIVVENHPEIPFISGLHTIVAKSKTEFLDLNYKKYCFQAKYIKDQFQYFAVGTKVSGVSKSSVKQIDLYFPKMEEQIEIGKILSSMDSEIQNINNKLSKALLLKQGLMQELLTGSTRLV